VFGNINRLKKKLRILNSIRDQRAKKQVNKGTDKGCETREVSYTCRYTMVDIYS